MVKQVSTREFMRNFKALREGLKRGEFEEIHVEERNGYILRVLSKPVKTPFESFVEAVKKRPLKGLRRPKEDLF